jgi:hypothetical protein
LLDLLDPGLGWLHAGIISDDVARARYLIAGGVEAMHPLAVRSTVAGTDHRFNGEFATSAGVVREPLVYLVLAVDLLDGPVHAWVAQ